MKKLKTYKNHNIYNHNGLIAVNKVEDGEDRLFYVAEDDPKQIENQYKNIETVIKYIDSITKKK